MVLNACSLLIVQKVGDSFMVKVRENRIFETIKPTNLHSLSTHSNFNPSLKPLIYPSSFCTLLSPTQLGICV